MARQIAAELRSRRDLRSTPYVTSNACARCHPSHVASHRATYHSRMTQDAKAATVLGHFDGSMLDYGGVRARMVEEPAGRFAMEFSTAAGARWSADVVRTVGSHRYQQYLARDRDVYFRLPIAWDVANDRFIHMNGAFLTADPRAPGGVVDSGDYNRHVTRWNDNCVFCHNVHPNPALDPRTGEFATEVAELGVACEACHGPAAEHVAVNENPLRRYALHASMASDPTIRNPARMSGPRSAEVCGRCHGQRLTAHVEDYLRAGDPFVPGEELAHYSTPLARDTRQNGQPGVFAPRFWEDGTARLTAYEFQGFVQSPCAASAAFSCESCHAMHRGDPAGQLRPERTGDAACTSCHAALASPLAAAEHSRHRADGDGARCVNCHMPEVVYGLVSVHLSHRIEVPDPARQARDNRPDACTLCHVDQSRTWAIAAIARHAQPETDDALPEQTERLFAGDPIERAVAAHALGSPRAHYRPEYEPRIVGLLTDVMALDPYPAVRGIAAQSLRSRLATQQPEAAALAAEFVATDDAAARALQLDRLRGKLPMPSLRRPDAAQTAALRATADRVAIDIGE